MNDNREPAKFLGENSNYLMDDQPKAKIRGAGMLEATLAQR
jgi:hypothetical protein